MNELIKELAEQAFNEYESVYKSDANIPKEFTEKFAELIVKECSSICYNSSMADSDAHAQNLLYEFNIDNCREDK